MSQRHKKNSHHRGLSKSREWMLMHSQDITPKRTKPTLEFVLKCDSAGSVEAVTKGISEIALSDIDISIIRSGVGDINMSDLLMAGTGSNLIIGHEVEVLHGLDNVLKERGAEVRLYNVIYKLINDVRNIAARINPPLSQDQIIGSARVLALFKSSRKGIIIGCKVLRGHLAPGQTFRIISAMGPIYSGRIESLQIDRNAVNKANAGQQAGIKIRGFDKVKTGDLVESFRPLPKEKTQVWYPRGEIIRI
jgi:translation initiation factor IF-2